MLLRHVSEVVARIEVMNAVEARGHRLASVRLALAHRARALAADFAKPLLAQLCGAALAALGGKRTASGSHDRGGQFCCCHLNLPAGK
jgi:hypothetical protein